MSYCRFGTKGSDVYVYRGGNYIACHVANDVFVQEWQGHNFYALGENQELEMVGHLVRLRLYGIRVPQKAIDRLVREVTYVDA